MAGELQLKLMTKKAFDEIKTKFVNIHPEAEQIINTATNHLDVLALTVQDGSGFTILSAKVLNESKEEDMLLLLKEGIDCWL